MNGASVNPSHRIHDARFVTDEMRGRVFGLLRTLMQSTPPLGGALAAC